MQSNAEKICAACETNKSTEEFEKIPNTRSSDGRSYFCNECKGTLSVKQREVILARHRRKIYTDYKDRPRGGHLKRTYSITASEYSIMLEQQGNVCAICKKPETAIRNGKLQLIAVDHCHSSGKIRALLCHKCNQGLGAFHDDPLLLRAAAEYIEEF